MVSFDYTMKNPQGLHARPAGAFVKKVKPLNCQITVTCGNRSGDGKKLFSLMNMAIKGGETVTVTFDGDDESTVCNEVQTFFEENF